MSRINKVPTLEQIEAAALLLGQGDDPTVASLCDLLGVGRNTLRNAHGAGEVRKAIDRARFRHFAAKPAQDKPAEDAKPTEDKPLARSTDFSRRRARFKAIMESTLAKQQQQTSPVLRLPVADATALDPRLESALVDLSTREVCPTLTTCERLEVVRLALEVRARATLSSPSRETTNKIDALVDAALKEVL